MSTKPATTDAALLCVPAVLSLDQPVPEPARKIAFFRAFVLHWLWPSRYGPHLAVGGMWLALLACALSGVIAATAVECALVAKETPHGFGVHAIRRDLAQWVLTTAAATSGDWWGPLIPIAIVLAIPLYWLIFIALGTLFMPWCAAGDSTRSVWRRSVLNALWSGTLLAPMVLLWAGLYLWLAVFDIEREQFLIVGIDDDPQAVLSHLAAVLLYVAMPTAAAAGLLHAMMSGASRFVGPATALAFNHIETLCENCGYPLVGLPLTTNCPECGRAMGDLFNSARLRVLTDAGDGRMRLTELPRLLWLGISQADLTQPRPISGGIDTARRVFVFNLAMLIAAPLAIAVTMAFDSSESPLSRAAVIAGALLGPVLVVMVIMLAACVWGRLLWRISDLRVPFIVVSHRLSCLWLAAAAVYAAAISVSDNVTIVAMVITLVSSIWCWLRICRGLRELHIART